MDSRLVRAIELLTVNPAKRVLLPQLARQVGLSVRMLELLFKTQKGKGFARYYRDMRMALAVDQIKKTEQPIKVIASRLGYRAVEVFCRDFKRVYRCTPREYRARSPKTVITEKVNSI